MKMHINRTEFKSLMRHLQGLEQIHQYDQEVLSGVKFAQYIAYNSESAFSQLYDFFKTDRDILGEHSQKDRIAFLELCKKLKDDNASTQELEISIDTPQRRQTRLDTDDDGKVYERTVHLFSGRSAEQERLERERVLRQQQQHTQEYTPNFMGPFNTAADHQKHIERMQRDAQIERFRKLRQNRATRPDRGPSHGFDMGR